MIKSSKTSVNNSMIYAENHYLGIVGVSTVSI